MNKYYADASKKELRGPVTMKKPDESLVAYRHQEFWEIDNAAYNDHLATLPVAFPAPWLKDSDDGQILEEGKDFKKVRGKQIHTTDQQQWQEMDRHEKDLYFEVVAVKIEASDEIQDEIRMIISHAFLGEDQNISKSSFDLAISECAKYFRNHIPVPINQDKQQERMFTLEEVLQVWDAAHLRGFQFEQFSGKLEAELPSAFNKEDYFKQKFNIDL